MCAHRAVYCLKPILQCRICKDFNQSDNHMDNHVHFSTSVFNELQFIHLESLPSTKQLKQYYYYKYETSSERKDLQGKSKILHKKVIQQSNQQADLQLRESRQDEKS